MKALVGRILDCHDSSDNEDKCVGSLSYVDSCKREGYNPMEGYGSCKEVRRMETVSMVFHDGVLQVAGRPVRESRVQAPFQQAPIHQPCLDNGEFNPWAYPPMSEC